MTRGRRAAGAIARVDSDSCTLSASGTATNTGGVRKDPRTSQAILRASKPVQQRKYKNIPTKLDGITFDSRREAERYGQLRVMQLSGAIRSLAVHERFPLVVHGEDCGAYEADFTYLDAEGRPHVEDVKSAATRKLPTYRLKAKLMFALYGIRVEEV